jgi:hypothetical protein
MKILAPRSNLGASVCRPTEPILNETATLTSTAHWFSRRYFLWRAGTPIKRFCYSFRSGEFIKNRYSLMDSAMNGTDFSGDNTGQRFTEIGALLAQALMRLQTRQSSAFVADAGESSLHFTPNQSGHAEPFSPEVTA